MNDQLVDKVLENENYKAQMMQLRPNCDGFRRIPEHSNQVSLVERRLIAAGDMSPPPRVPDDRSYRRARVARKEEAKLVPTKHRSQDLEPNDQLVDKVLENYKAKTPARLVLALIGRMGYSSIEAYDTAALRAERFMRNLKPGKRVPNHIRDKFVLKRLVERCLEKRFGSKAVLA